MGAFADLRDRVGDALDTVCVAYPDWSVLRLPVDSLAPPAYMLGWSDPWVSGQSTFCRYDVALDVRCIAARIEPDPGIELLEEMIEAAAVALDQAHLPVRFVLPPRPFPIGGVTYQAALLTVTATVQLTAPAAPVGGVSGAAHLTALALLTAAATVIAAGIIDGALELAAAAALTAAGTVVAAATIDGVATMTAAAALTAAGTVVAVPAWSPADLPGIVDWFDASGAATITAAGGKVSQWAGKLARATLTQAVAANQPFTGATQNGRAVVSFDGVDDVLADLAAPAANAATVSLYAVFYFAPNPDFGTPFVRLGGGNVVWGLVPGGNNRVAVQGDYGGNFAGATASAGAAHQFTAIGGATAVLRLDGTNDGTGAGANGAEAGLKVGQAHWGAPATLWLAEFFWTNVNNTAADRDQAESYLRAKWGTP